MCWPCSFVLRPLETLLAERAVSQGKRTAILAAGTAVSLMSTAVAGAVGMLAGIGIDDAMCSQHQCQGTTDLKSLASTVFPFVGVVVGCVAAPILIHLGCQTAHCCLSKGGYTQMNDVEEGE